jgi:4-amino-4-deoxy-L-arabinose transferase-like glycosyltransferase
MTSATTQSVASSHWLICLLQRLGQVAGVTILLGILGYPVLHWRYFGPPAPWLVYGAVALGFGLAIALWTAGGLWHRGLAWLAQLSRKAYVRILLVTCFVAHFIVLRIIDALPQAQRAPDPWGSWVYFEKSAMYPPGHDAMAAVVSFILGPSGFATVLYVSVLVSAAAWLIYRIGTMAFGETAGRVAGLWLALFPSWLLYGNFEYHLEMGTLLLLIVYLFFVRPVRNHSVWYVALIGTILGLACLVKPIALPFPAAALVLYVAMGTTWGMAIKRAAILTVFMLLAIMPWTIRNYVVLNHFVLVSTNAGLVLHTANNPDSIGTEMAMPPQPGETDEVVKDSRHMREAVDWIVHNPLQFLRLTGYRVAMTWGSDTAFINCNACLYGKVPPLVLDAVRGVAQVSYLATVFLWILAMFAYRRQIMSSVISLVLLALVLHTWAIHLIMQAHSEHHMIVLPSIIVLASAAMVRRIDGNRQVLQAEPAIGEEA